MKKTILEVARSDEFQEVNQLFRDLRRNLKLDDIEEDEQDIVINELWVLCNDFRKQLEDAALDLLGSEDYAHYQEALAYYTE